MTGGRSATDELFETSSPILFELDPHLARDGVPLAELPLCHVRLARDFRFPWLVAVPRITGAEELTDLAPSDRALLMEEVALLAGALQAETGAHKINIATLGNIVRQLHVHVVARFEDDGAWPGPVWGSGPPKPYPAGAIEELIVRLRGRLSG